MSRSKYQIWSEKKLAQWFEATSSAEQNILLNEAEGHDFTWDITQNATAEDWKAGVQISKNWKANNLNILRGGQWKWWLSGLLSFAIIIGAYVYLKEDESVNPAFTPAVSTQPSPIPNLPKQSQMPLVPSTQSSSQEIDVEKIERNTSGTSVENVSKASPSEAGIDTIGAAVKEKEVVNPKIEQKKPPKKDQTEKSNIVKEEEKDSVIEEKDVVVKIRTIREITVLEKVSDNDKNKRYAASDLVSYAGGKEVLKGELYDLLKDEMKIKDIPASARSVVFEFWVNSNGSIQDVHIMTRLSTELEDKINTAVNSLVDWSEGSRRIDVGYTVYVTFY